MNAFLDYLTVLSLFLLLAAPALVGHAHERRIDRQLRAAEVAEAADDAAGGLLLPRGERTRRHDFGRAA
ncbi:hypothetical protein H1V43_30085 [Streptomyces sp. PSKA54]|uniref:Uncharacterized protein n=1 Tax=Streptomyces himalayensis subsp. aureolus TaxID=2758039 RepID=A0A7W2HJ60_9ACTN|nr:hypothetical protein [Streptomyces himalayensis]MBA4865514.1 hypothetical protein [Streptomyces himalayensis subsp. aureolus]